MKIWCQLPISMSRSVYASYYELLQKDYDLIKRPDTETVIMDVPTGVSEPELVAYYGLRQINDTEILKSIIRAEKEGFDGVAGACFSDGSIRTAASLMGIPVIGPGETAMFMARMMGMRFAIITSDSPPETEHYMDMLYMRPHAISNNPVRKLTLDSDTFLQSLEGNYDPVIENFNKQAISCIQDGADVLIAGCGLISPMLTVNGVHEINSVPVIDPMQVALKYAEMMIDFKASGMPIISNSGLFKKPSVENMQMACQALGLR